MSTDYGMKVSLALGYDAAVGRVKEELAKEGFGVLTEIDVRKTLKEKLDADFRPYVILGACNPPLAKRALEAEPEIGTLLPCNVCVWDDGGGRSTVAAFDPMAMIPMSRNRSRVEPVAREVHDRLARVVAAIAR
jgi:uncharacterized protein (DUF302 family)